eukprot:TRINITY_DN400_c3_g1_i1.p1 TRINITY_DN400_c3_g1~~TRINITY_DN400_c3_g1_i1.p1  ORF type:complete len:1058 (+),score=360.52 TRINITY_DN400_c3_g1_i1:1014-4187(+)
MHKKKHRLSDSFEGFDAKNQAFRMVSHASEQEPLVSPRKPSTSFRSHWDKFVRFIKREPVYEARTVYLNRAPSGKFAANVVRNQKYNMITFVPVILYEQFKFFFNLYFLVVALSQFIPILQIGFLFTYIAPLAFVLTVTIAKEAWDDFKRFLRDKEANGKLYKRLTDGELQDVPSSDIRVGDLIEVSQDQRVPADLVFLRTTDKNGSCFIRTDQLDGETDWKLRRAVNYTQHLGSYQTLAATDASVYAEMPKKDIYSFVGNLTKPGHVPGTTEVEGLNVENTLWANTVVASGTVLGIVVYTGRDSKSVMNTSAPSTKVGSVDLEINRLSKVLCVLLIILSVLMTILKGFHGLWYIYLCRFLLLFSSIIPISLRVNLDMAKTLYALMITRDKEIDGTIVRTSTIPEELGRIEFLLTDKTGTLTQNDMVFIKLHLGTVSFSKEALDEIKVNLKSAYVEANEAGVGASAAHRQPSKLRRTMSSRIREAVRALALCHNVTPVVDEDSGSIAYQASSPDEVALVKFTELSDLVLAARDVNSITLRTPLGDLESYEVLNIFPFTSESKRMGIIIRDASGAITFYVKGADVVMAKIVQYNEWLEEECDNMAREGLRTLVFGKKALTDNDYKTFAKRYQEARTALHNRDAEMMRVVESLEADLELLCVTGVEDKLQDKVRSTLELLANAGIKTWMLTGDKMETARCIAISARLVNRNQSIFPFSVKTREEAAQLLQSFSVMRDACLIIDGSSLQLCLDNMCEEFVTVACGAPCVVCCRCSPTQKAEIVKLIMKHKHARTCAIGDGGNDVSMIQAADVGIGIVGKEGKQASLAADFSVNQFSFISRLLFWHGRNSYRRSARLSQFIIHRGLIISFIQAVFSALYYFAAIAIYNGWLLVGYATLYTMAPVFCLVLDTDVSETVAFRYPELYKDLQKGRSLSFKTFSMWVFTSVFQAGAIMLMSLVLFDQNLINIVSITFTALILTELANVAFEIHTWNRYIVVSELGTVLIYFGSMFMLPMYFDLSFIFSLAFVWRVALVTVVACLPLYLVRAIRRRIDPPSYTKLS